ncbi:MAG: siroheme synthase CysG [Rhizobiaceae bacterium]|nr:siroheme synthase CysG [Rhizobiaceae bacterium]
MRHFPIFLKVQNKRILVAGGGETAIAKLRLLLKTEAEIVVFAEHPEAQVLEWADEGLITLLKRDIRADDFYNVAMVYGAEDDDERDQMTATMGRMAGVLSNIVDNLQDSQFITPAIVDRDPVTVAIGTEGTAPVVARKIKSDIEKSLPSELGILARIGEAFRPNAMQLPAGSARRNFWSRFFFERGANALKQGGEEAVKDTLEALLDESLNEQRDEGQVFFVGAGPGDPDLLTRKALKVLHEADVVIHDRLVSSQILELARREADIIQTGKKGFGPSWKQNDINTLMVEHASQGAMVVRLKSGDPAVFGRLDEEMDALDDAGVRFEIIPGITTASAAAAQLNVSLTKRKRNSALRIMTAHDIKGFAEHDWHDLARNGAVAAIYMGLKQAHFLSGRLLMHGAAPDIPVTIMENVSRSDQRISVSTLGSLAKDAEVAGDTGPVILMLGLEPREAAKQAVFNANEIANLGSFH